MERSSQLPNGRSPNSGLIVVFFFGALASLGLSFLVELLIGLIVGSVGMGFLSGLVEEPLKGLAVTIVVAYMWKALPNRRYGATLGASAGFGFGLAEGIEYVARTPTAGMFVLRIFTAIMHPMWSAIVGIGIFTLVASKATPPGGPASSKSMRTFFLLVAIGLHITWNAIDLGFALADVEIVGILLDYFIVLPLSAILLRDFLGGHFDFQNFLHSELEVQPSLTPAQPLPPPPPP
jgi:RsiW-degrading membrane proteinase PrsW (M82 family)